MAELRFRPDWTSSPGDTISDVLRENGMSVAQFAAALGRTEGEIDELLAGNSPLTLATARQLSSVLGSSVEFWMSRDFQYHSHRSRIGSAWLQSLPVADMVKFGWLRADSSHRDQLSECLHFFQVESVTAWRESYSCLWEAISFRTSNAFTSNPAAVTAWLRQGEIEAARIQCGHWNSTEFRRGLNEIRRLTRRKDPHQFLPDLVRLCATNGVAVAVVRAPDGCRASGATRFLSGEKAMLMLSVRHLTDDQFWFTFFHEAAHLILHEGSFFLEGEGRRRTAEEDEANDFAARVLIPDETSGELERLKSAFDIIRFAVEIGVAPGIVVGQMQYRKQIRFNQFNRLKRRYSWKD
jgi:HTH-type transcriptional regulator/antitoxin HigA